MRKAFFLFVCMLVALNTFSKTTTARDIELRARHADDEALRSIIPVRAMLDEDILSVEFWDSPKDAVIRITDADGNEILSKAYTYPELVQLPINQKVSIYTIEITLGEICFSGYFCIE